MSLTEDNCWSDVDKNHRCEEMVAMFLHILTHNVNNKVIQRDFVWSRETILRHFTLVLLAVLQLHNELLKKPQSVTKTCTDAWWRCFEVRIFFNFVTYESRSPTIWLHYVSICITALEHWMGRTSRWMCHKTIGLDIEHVRRKLPQTSLVCVTRKVTSCSSWLAGKGS